MPDRFDLTMTFPSTTTIEMPSGSSIAFPGSGQPSIPLYGAGITISFPVGSGLTFEEGSNVKIEIPGQSEPIDLSSSGSGNLKVTVPGHSPVTLEPTSPMGVSIPELGPPPFELPRGSTVSLTPDGPTIELPIPHPESGLLAFGGLPLLPYHGQHSAHLHWDFVHWRRPPLDPTWEPIPWVGMLDEFVRIRDANEVVSFVVKRGPLGLCEHGLPATHNRSWPPSEDSESCYHMGAALYEHGLGGYECRQHQ